MKQLTELKERLLGKGSKPLTAKEQMLPYLLSPSTVENQGDCIKVGEHYHKSVSVVGIPRLVKAGFLNPLILEQGEFDLSLHLNPKQTDHTVTQLNHELIKLAADLHSMEARGDVVPPSLRLKYDDTLRVLSALQSGEEQLFDLGFYINLRGASKEKLDESLSRLSGTMGQLSLLHKHLDYRLHDALPTVMPIATDRIGTKRSMTTSALAACFPFTSSNLQVMEKGIIFGVNDFTGIPIVLDLHQLHNPNMLVIGSSGSGKSFTTKTLLTRMHRLGTRIFVVDPQGEYSKLAAKLGAGAQVISFSPESQNSINPLDAMGLTLSEKVQSLMGLFTIMAGGELSAAQRAFLDEALYAVYERHGVSDESRGVPRQYPTFTDVYEYAKACSEDKGSPSTTRATALAMANRLKPYTRGSLKCFNRQTNVNLQAQFIVFDVSYFVDKMQTVAPPSMYILLDYLLQQMKRDPLERKAVVVDEAWRLLRSPQASEYLLLFAKTSRKYNTSLQIISQELGDLSESQAGSSVLANTAVKLLLRQDPTEIEEVAKALKLSPNDKTRILTSPPGHGLLLVENSRVPYYCISMPEELSFLSTKPEELKGIKLAPKEAGKKPPGTKIPGGFLDFKAGCYRKRELTQDELVVLIQNGFTVASAYDLLERCPADFVVKRRFPESIQHTVFVKQIEEIIREYTQAVKVSTSVDADIVFVDKEGKKIALEIETGLNNHLSAKMMAVRARNYDETHFVLTNSALTEIYKPYGRILTRSQVEEFIRRKLG